MIEWGFLVFSAYGLVAIVFVHAGVWAKREWLALAGWAMMAPLGLAIIPVGLVAFGYWLGRGV